MNNDELKTKIDINGKQALYLESSGFSDERTGHKPVTVKHLMDSYFDAVYRAQRYQEAAENVRQLVLRNTTHCPFCQSNAAQVFTTMEEAAEAQFGTLTQQQKDQWG